MPKICSYKGCKYNQFGGDFCRNHQWCRTDKKPKKPLSKKPINKTSKKHRITLVERKALQQKDWLFYLEIWNEREHVCFETGVPILGEPLTVYFHHVLEKGTQRYKKFRHCKWNIVIITQQVHDQVGMDIDKCPKIKEYRDYIIKKYIK